MKKTDITIVTISFLLFALAGACGSGQDNGVTLDTPANGDDPGTTEDTLDDDLTTTDTPDPDMPGIDAPDPDAPPPDLPETDTPATDTPDVDIPGTDAWDPDAWEYICDEEDLGLTFDVSSDVLIVLDRSGSMMGMLGRVETAINTIAAASDDKIWFGLMPFPSSVLPNECRLFNPFSECYAPATAHVELGINRAPDIAGVLSGLGICGSTPTTQTLINAHAYLNATVTGHTQYILLATDGVPNCNSSLDPDTCVCLDTDTGCDGRPEACLDDEACYDALDDLFADGIMTYVIGMGAWLGGDADIMDEMARRGGTEHFYPAEAPDELLAVFEDIMATVVVSCRFDLNPSEFADPTKVNFYIDGEIVPRDDTHMNGWDYVDADTVEFFGPWCERIMSGDVSGVTATYGCPTMW